MEIEVQARNRQQELARALALHEGDEPARVVLQLPDEGGHRGIWAGGPVHLVRADDEQHHAREDPQPGDQPASVRARHLSSMTSTDGALDYSFLHSWEREYLIFCPYTSPFRRWR